jgi:hypothetical protein
MVLLGVGVERYLVWPKQPWLCYIETYLLSISDIWALY